MRTDGALRTENTFVIVASILLAWLVTFVVIVGGY